MRIKERLRKESIKEKNNTLKDKEKEKEKTTAGKPTEKVRKTPGKPTEKVRKTPGKPLKSKFGEFNHVLLTDEEVVKLTEKFNSKTEDYEPNQDAQWVPSGNGYVNKETGEYLPNAGSNQKKTDTREGPCSTSVKDAMSRARTRQ